MEEESKGISETVVSLSGMKHSVTWEQPLLSSVNVPPFGGDGIQGDSFTFKSGLSLMV